MMTSFYLHFYPTYYLVINHRGEIQDEQHLGNKHAHFSPLGSEPVSWRVKNQMKDGLSDITWK